MNSRLSDRKRPVTRLFIMNIIVIVVTICFIYISPFLASLYFPAFSNNSPNCTYDKCPNCNLDNKNETTISCYIVASGVNFLFLGLTIAGVTLSILIPVRYFYYTAKGAYNELVYDSITEYDTMINDMNKNPFNMVYDEIDDESDNMSILETRIKHACSSLYDNNT